MRKSTAMAMMVCLVLGACNQDAGLATDPAAASSCAELADVAMNQLQVFIDQAVGTESQEEFVEAFEADGGEAFNEATAIYSEHSFALDARRSEVGCTDEEFRMLLCSRLEGFEVAGTAATQLLEPSRAACR